VFIEAQEQCPGSVDYLSAGATTRAGGDAHVVPCDMNDSPDAKGYKGKDDKEDDDDDCDGIVFFDHRCGSRVKTVM
jgi:hypothetical protein